MSLHNPFHPRISRSVKKRLIISFVCVFIGALIFALLYDNVREQNDLVRLDAPTLAWLIGHRSQALTAIMQVVTSVASPIILGSLTVIGSAVWAWRKRELWRPSLLVGAMGLAIIITAGIKLFTGRSRPPMADMILPLEVDFSFPSGHTIGIAVFMLVAGYLIYSRAPTARRLITWLATTVIVVGLVATSRLYLAYHWVTDISASIGLSLVILGGVILIDTVYTARVANATEEPSGTLQ